MDASRPLDALNESRNKRVIVELKNGKQFRGELKSFDIHINMVLVNAEEHIIDESLKDGSLKLKRKLGLIFIRGDTIIFISPE